MPDRSRVKGFSTRINQFILAVNGYFVEKMDFGLLLSSFHSRLGGF